MMLKTLILKNFRKHEATEMRFGPGLTVIRGDNEMGKTTLIEAVGYALFGVKACRDSLEEVVTWGQPLASLRVTLTLEVGGQDYTISRHKGGAEVQHAGGKVVGQSECSAFIERLFGVSMGNCHKLLIASQNEIRGALQQGPKATMDLIQSLAGFEVIDTVLERIQAQRLTGNTGMLEDRLSRLQAEAAAFELPAVDLTELSVRLAQAQVALDASHARFTELEAQVEAAKAQGRALQQHLTDYQVALGEMDLLRKSLEQARAQYAAAVEQASVPTPTARIAELRQSLNDAERAAKSVRLRQRLTALAYPEVFWEGDRASLLASIQEGQALLREAERTIQEGQTRVQVLTAQRVSSSVCGLCGEDVSKFPAAAARNADLAAQVAELQPIIANAETKAKALRRELQALQQVADNEQFSLLAAEAGDWIAADDSFYPPRLTWVGPVFDRLPDRAALRAELEQLERQSLDIQIAMDRVQQLHTDINRFEARIKDADQRITTLRGPASEAQAHGEMLVQIEADLKQVRIQYEEARGEYNRQNLHIKQQRQMLAAAEQQRQRLLQQVAEARQELAELHWNNTLLKRVRAVRPLIVDKLWHSVLATISTYFSSMRGKPSVVSKAADGFKVDGRSVNGLSGSTLDVLGLAIRAALLRTFLPNLNLLILDEPAANCDADRASNVLGLLASLQFGQVLMITHEDTAESVAQHFISL